MDSVYEEQRAMHEERERLIDTMTREWVAEKATVCQCSIVISFDLRSTCSTKAASTAIIAFDTIWSATLTARASCMITTQSARRAAKARRERSAGPTNSPSSTHGSNR